MRTRKIGVVVIAVLFGAVIVRPALAAATCTTYDAQSLPTSTFRAGEKIIIKGTGFGPNARVLLSLQQGTRNIELGGADANDLGAFDAADAAIPRTVAEGPAAIRAIDARGSATCQVTLEAAAQETEDGMSGLFWIWGALLAAFAIVLGVLTYRRWKTERLKEAVDTLAGRERFDEDGDRRPVPTRSARDATVVAGRPGRVPGEPPVADRGAWDRAPLSGARPADAGPTPATFDPVLPPPRRAFDESMRSTAPLLDDDDDSPIGAPRPFDDRFLADPRHASTTFALGDDRGDRDDPADRRPLPIVRGPDARHPLTERLAPERPVQAPPPARDPDRDRAAFEPPAARVPSSDTQPLAAAAASASDRSFAEALREFLDAEDARLEHPHAEFRPRERSQPPATHGGAPSEPPLLDRPFVPTASTHATPARTPDQPSRAVVEPWAPHSRDEGRSMKQAADDVAEDEPIRAEPVQHTAGDAAETADDGEEPPAPDVPRAPSETAGVGTEPAAYEPPAAHAPGPAAPQVQRRSAPPRWEPPPSPADAERTPPPRAVPRPAAARPVPRRRVAADASVQEPPVLPVGWDDGRLGPAGKRSSDSIERLRREVQDWHHERE